MKLRFKASAALPVYISAETGELVDGREVELADYEAERRLRDFPDNFLKVEIAEKEMIMDGTGKPSRSRKSTRPADAQG